MKNVTSLTYQCERALFHSEHLEVNDCKFEIGESPLKESSHIHVNHSSFIGRYPLWYMEDVIVKDSYFGPDARAGMWYTNNMTMSNCTIDSPKSLRRCDQLLMENVSFTSAPETLWNCSHVKMNHVKAVGDYFAKDASFLELNDFELDGKYSFDGVKNVTIRNSRLQTKDAFWNSENVTVYDSFIFSEYLGWNAKNLTLINCTIISNQALCYVDNLVMKNCICKDTTLAFEYSSCDVELTAPIDSIFNPSSGTITVPSIGTLILEKNRTNIGKTTILCPDIKRTLDHPEWLDEQPLDYKN